MSEPLKQFLQNCQQRIDDALAEQLGSFNAPYCDNDSSAYLANLAAAMNYSLLSGGKRIRPALVYAAAQAIDSSAARADSLNNVAAAVEMIHAYSLIHDDLPAMDDDDLRRGQPTCHKAFDEATAILAGDALQARAFEVITEITDRPADDLLRLINTLACAAGQRGMVGGQAMDLQSVGQQIDLSQLETIHLLKTGALIRASVGMGAIHAGASTHQLKALDRYGEAIGLAFQVQDDILDIESSTEQLGKTQGADQALNKPTYPALLGMEAAKQLAQLLHEQAMQALADFDDQAQPLRDLSAFIIARQS